MRSNIIVPYDFNLEVIESDVLDIGKKYIIEKASKINGSKSINANEISFGQYSKEISVNFWDYIINKKSSDIIISKSADIKKNEKFMLIQALQGNKICMTILN